MRTTELFSAINVNLRLMVAVDDSIFGSPFKNLFRAIDFKGCCTTLELVTVALDKIQNAVNLNANHWKLELGEQGLTLVNSYLALLKEASVKLCDVSRNLALKIDRLPYSFKQYQADLKDYQRLGVAYKALGVGMNNLSRGICAR